MRRLSFILLLLIWPWAMFSQVVTFSQSGGFYENSFNLALTCDGAYQIRYTTNGNIPTASSTLYTQPLTLNESLYSHSNIYTIINCDTSAYYSVNDVERVIVIRAAAFDSADSCISAIKTNTYIINSLGACTHGLPVVSIVTDSLSLFDYYTGIFVQGASYDPNATVHTGNYINHGREWERRVNVEFYETDNTGINQECGLRTTGNASRWFQQKGMKLYAREEYGKKRFHHQFFDDCYFNNFKHLKLRPFRCSNWLKTGAQDYLANRIAANLDIDAMAVRQVAVYLNGEYWGIYTLEESPDERYIEDHYNANPDEVNIMKYWSGVQDHGDPADWRAFYNWIKNADLTQPEDSLIAFTRIDVHNFIDYMIFQLYSANIDWPQNNVRIWQKRTGEQFRFVFYDGDGCLTRWYFKAFEHAINSGGHSTLFNKFLENGSFRRMFYNRYMELKQTHLRFDAIKPYIDHYRDAVIGEVPKQSQRFGFPNSLTKFESDMDTNYIFIARRAEVFEPELQNFVFVNELSIDYFSCYPNPSSGEFKLNIGACNDACIEVKVFNSIGQMMISKKYNVFEGDNSISMNVNMPSGLYFLKIGNKTQKIIIQ